MGKEKIPEAYRFTCDSCKKEIIQSSGGSRPQYWATLKLEQAAYDYQGAAVADGTRELLLCDPCKGIAWDAAMKALTEESRG